MDDNILSALKSIPVAELTRAEWIAVGMALKEEGFPCSVWEDWSRNDSRYHRGECEKKWAGFNGSGKPVKGGTIVQMAQARGWKPFPTGPMDWDDAISYDGADAFSGFPTAEWDPVADLVTYLETLFEPDDIVAYVTNDAWMTQDGKWVPSKGRYDRTAKQLIASLKKHPEDIGAVIGDWKQDAGAWIRFNAVDGKGVKNENVTTFRFALVESDTLPIAEQDALYRKLELPIAALVHSGGKSLHAIVRVDAKDAEEYRQRVDFLYDFLGKHGLDVDRQNRNPSRLSRMPGVTRNGNRQYLAGTNIGRRSWADWMDFVEGISDELPEIISLETYIQNPPQLPETLIDGVLRRGHKMLVAGPSKAGKSFLLMELCVSIAEGLPWLDFQVKKGRVLYINLEIDPASAYNRFAAIYDAMGIEPENAKDIEVWNLRGHAVPLDQLVPKLIRRIRDQHFDAIVLDPIYKVITGDENNASEMGAFCNQFDKICAATGCSMIYCHHHSKGAQGGKKVIDRASGSGVFARDPDAQLDIVELETDEFTRDDGATAWRLESSLREFPNIRPINIWFDYPLHRVDSNGTLSSASVRRSKESNLSKSGKNTTPEQRRRSVDTAFDVCSIEQPVTVAAMANYLGVTIRTMRERIKEYSDKYIVKFGAVFKIEDDEK